MQRRGLREKIQYATNPFPVPPPGTVWSQRYFAGLCDIVSLQVARVGSELRTVWIYGSGGDSEVHEFKEGEMHELRASEASAFLREKGELGYVLIEDPSDEDHVRERKLEGVRRAIDFYENGMRGADKLIELAAIHSLNDQQMSQQKRTYWIYHVNAKIGEFLNGYFDAGAPRDFGRQWLEQQGKRKAIRAA